MAAIQKLVGRIEAAFARRYTLTVGAESTTGAPLTNFQMSIPGANPASGKTPCSFVLRSGKNYALTAETTFQGCLFSAWADGVTANPRTVSLTANADLTALYRCPTVSPPPVPLPPPPSPSPPPPVSPPVVPPSPPISPPVSPPISPPSPPATYSIEVGTVDQNGNAITGYFVTLKQPNGTTLNGYSPVTFGNLPAGSYVVAASSYSVCSFTAWSTGQTGALTVALNQDTALVAQYSCSDAPSPPPSPPVPILTSITAKASVTSGTAPLTSTFSGEVIDQLGNPFTTPTPLKLNVAGAVVTTTQSLPTGGYALTYTFPAGTFAVKVTT